MPSLTKARWTISAADDSLLESKALAVDLYRIVSGEAAVAQEDVDAQALEARGRVMVAEPRAYTAHTLHGRREVDLHASGDPDADRGSCANVADRSRRPDHGLRGHAADVEAVAAHEIALDECHASAETGGARRRHQAGSAGADHDQVVARGRSG